MQLKTLNRGLRASVECLWGAGFPRLVPPSNEGTGRLHHPLFLYAVKDGKSGPGVADVGAGSGVINGASGACPLRRGARIPTFARPGARVLLDTYTLLVTRRAVAMVAENALRAAACAADWGAPRYSSACRVTFGCRVSLLGFGAKSLLGRYSAGRFLPVSTGFPFACARWCGWRF